jgi:hypothetical protein
MVSFDLLLQSLRLTRGIMGEKRAEGRLVQLH